MGNASATEHPKFNKTSSALVAMFVDLLRNYFTDNTRYTYSTAASQTKIAIQPSYGFTTEGIGKRPAIYVKRGPVQFAKYVLGHRLGYQPDGTMILNSQQQGYLTLMCMSDKPLEAEIIATEVGEFLQGFCIIIANEFNFLTLNVDAIGDLGILEEHKEIYVAPVTITYAAPKVWGVWQESVKLKKAVFRIQEILAGDVEIEDILKGNGDDPQHIGVDLFPGGEAGIVNKYPEDEVENEIIFDDEEQQDGLADYGNC